MQKRTKVVLVMLLVMVFGCSELAGKPRAKQIPSGAWGGPHISIEINNGTATIEYDCANGTISGPLKLDRRGNFSLSGTHVREHGGPIRVNEQRSGQTALYTGWTDGKKMTLTVRLANTNESLGTFKLVHGQSGRVFKCK